MHTECSCGDLVIGLLWSLLIASLHASCYVFGTCSTKVRKSSCRKSSFISLFLPSSLACPLWKVPKSWGKESREPRNGLGKAGHATTDDMKAQPKRWLLSHTELSGCSGVARMATAWPTAQLSPSNLHSIISAYGWLRCIPSRQKVETVSKGAMQTALPFLSWC